MSTIQQSAAPGPATQPSFHSFGAFEQQAWSRLSDEAGRLFASTEVDLQTVRLSNNPTSSSQRSISNVAELDAFLQEHDTQADGSTFIFLRPIHSWGPLRITLDGFKRLIAVFPVSAAFVEYLVSFGTKIRDVDSNTGGYCKNGVHRLENSRQQLICYDFSLLLRYPEMHGRTAKNPWSLRQVAMYKSHNHEHNSSTWIFVQCPQNLQTQLVNALTATQNGAENTDSPIPLDFILTGTSQKWRDYINYLEDEIGALNEKACYSSVENMEPNDYVVGFTDAQTLQGIRRKLLKAIEAIDQALDVLAGIRKHTQEQLTVNAASNTPTYNERLDFHTARYVSYKRTLNALADFQQGASALVGAFAAKSLELALIRAQFLKMLDQRNDQVLHLQGKTMSDLALEAKREGVVMKELSEKMQEDSRAMRVLSAVALVYLPTGLVAGVFNSNLLRLVGPGEPTHASERLVVSSRIWVFVLSALILTAMTILGVQAWDKYMRAWEARTATAAPSTGP